MPTKSREGTRRSTSDIADDLDRNSDDRSHEDFVVDELPLGHLLRWIELNRSKELFTEFLVQVALHLRVRAGEQHPFLLTVVEFDPNAPERDVFSLVDHGAKFAV